MPLSLAPIFAGLATGSVFIISLDHGMSIFEASCWSAIPSIAVIGYSRAAAAWRQFHKAEVTSRCPEGQHDECPNCHEDALGNFLPGPSGGMAQNVLCSNCHHEFNILATDPGCFILIDAMGKPSEHRLAMVYGIGSIRTGPTYEPVPKGKFRFEIDGRPAAPIRDTLAEAHGDAVRNGYAVYTDDGIRLNDQGEIARG